MRAATMFADSRFHYARPLDMRCFAPRELSASLSPATLLRVCHAAPARCCSAMRRLFCAPRAAALPLRPRRMPFRRAAAACATLQPSAPDTPRARFDGAPRAIDSAARLMSAIFAIAISLADIGTEIDSAAAARLSRRFRLICRALLPPLDAIMSCHCFPIRRHLDSSLPLHYDFDAVSSCRLRFRAAADEPLRAATQKQYALRRRAPR